MCADHVHQHRYGDLFADWELQTAESLVSRFWLSSQRVRAAYEKEDLLQECLIHWHGVRDRYVATRGASQKTYMTRIVQNKLLELLRHEKADVRRINSEAVPFSTPLDSEEDRTIEDEADEAIGQEPDSFEESGVHDILGSLSLTPRQKEISDLLSQGFKKTEIAKKVGAHRDTVYQDIERIRKLFEEKGLKRFLE